MDSEIRKAVLAAALAEPCLAEPGRGVWCFCFASDFPGFAGHFPAYPVLPAMLQVLVGVMLCERIAGVGLKLLRVERAKFAAQIKPQQEIVVSCRLQGEGAGLTARVELASAGRKAASLQLSLEPEMRV